MTGKELEKFSDEFLDKIIEEGKVFLSETITAYKEFTSRSYAVFGFSSGLISFCINKALSLSTCSQIMPYLCVSIDSLISIIVLRKNLLPQNLANLGSNPKDLVNPFFAGEGKEKIKKYKISKALALQKGIDINIKENISRVNRFKTSIACVGIGLLLGIFFFFVV